MTRIMLVGCGRHMQGYLVPYLLRLTGYSIEVCVDQEATAAKTVQTMSHARTWATNVEDVDPGSIDAAIVALPPQAAYETTKYLIHQGIACFVEKPPADSTEHIGELWRLASSKQVYVQIGFNYRAAEALIALRRATSGSLAQPCTATLEFRSKHPSGPEWGVEDPVAAWLYHTGVHALDLIRWLVGDVKSVDAQVIQVSKDKFNAVLLLRHSNDSVSTLKVGNLIDKFSIQAEVFTADAAQYVMPHLGQVIFVLRAGRAWGESLYQTYNMDDGWGRMGYGPELHNFLEHYRCPEVNEPSLFDAFKAAQLADACMESFRTGKASSLVSNGSLQAQSNGL